uniref:MutS protein 5 n=1 Tax=Schistosoma haematobium TaxID=6185 RepID=A0A094ZX18_SCHHA
MLFVDKSAMKYLQIIDFHETYKINRGILPSEANISPTLFNKSLANSIYKTFRCGNHDHASSSRSLTNSHTEHTSGIPICCGDRLIALIIYLTHIGSYIPAEGATISAFDAIHILTGTNSTERDNCSTYMMALQMASVALRNLTSKTLIIMDEFAKPVNKLELDALTIAMTEFLLLKNECPYTIIATHNHTILRQLQMYGPQVQYLVSFQLEKHFDVLNTRQ